MTYFVRSIFDQEIDDIRYFLVKKNNQSFELENTNLFAGSLIEYRLEIRINGSSIRDYWESETPQESLERFGFSSLEIEEIFSFIDSRLDLFFKRIGLDPKRMEIVNFKTEAGKFSVMFKSQ